mgnify:FL=1
MARVLALDDDRTPGPVDDLLHQDVATLVGRLLGLPDVLVAEITEDIFHQVLELESREVVQYSYPQLCKYYVVTDKYVRVSG